MWIKKGNRIGNLCFDIKANYMKSIKIELIENHIISFLMMSFDTIFVGVAGFEPAASCSQSRRDNRATLHPETNFLNTGRIRSQRRDWDSNPGDGYPSTD